MENETLEMFWAKKRQETEEKVQEYLKEIDASKLVIYTGSDKEWLRKGIETAMRALGATVYHCADADELLDKVKSSPPDLVIVEKGFSGMEELRFVDILGADPQTRLQPILVITRLHTFVEFALEDKDRFLQWDNNYIVDCYFQQRVLDFLLWCARRINEAESGK